MTNTLIPERDSVLNTQYNAIRAEVLAHTHNGTNSGTKIKFSSLSGSDSLAPTGLNNSLEEIDNHIGSTTNHGIADGNGLLGCSISGSFIQSGFVGLSVGAGETKTAVITFEKPFSTTPVIVVSNYSTTTPACYISVQISAKSATQFTAVCATNWANWVAGMSGFSWIAIGT